jgi:hypothetical protein
MALLRGVKLNAPSGAEVTYRDQSDYDRKFGRDDTPRRRNRARRFMAAKPTTSGRNLAAELAYLTRGLKAPSFAAAVEFFPERVASVDSKSLQSHHLLHHSPPLRLEWPSDPSGTPTGHLGVAE